MENGAVGIRLAPRALGHGGEHPVAGEASRWKEAVAQRCEGGKAGARSGCGEEPRARAGCTRLENEVTPGSNGRAWWTVGSRRWCRGRGVTGWMSGCGKRRVALADRVETVENGGLQSLWF